jgi:UDP-glucose 4-epimerase
MRYVVTGGAGFIGSHLSGVLADRGHEVLIVDDLSTGHEENIQAILDGSRVTFTRDTVMDYEDLTTYFEGADGVFHLAAMVSVPRSIEHPMSSHDITLTGTLNVLLAARDTGVKKVVCASSAAVYGNLPGLPKKEEMPVDPLSPYAVAKLAGEHYARVFSLNYGLSTVSLRYFNVYGSRQDPRSQYAAAVTRFIYQIANGSLPVIYGDGEQTRDFVYVKDAVQANILAMESQAEGVFNIGSGKETSVNTLAATLLELFGVRGEPIHEPERPGEVKRSVADITKAKEAFGYRPEYGLKEGLIELGNETSARSVLVP